MAAKIFDCQKVSQHFFKQAKLEFGNLRRTPQLAIVSGIDNESANFYGELIKKDAESLGVSVRKSLSSNESVIRSSISNLNEEENVHGIVVLYPLGFKTERVEDIMNTVDPEKDIEGLHAINCGYLVQYKRFLKGNSGQKCVVPATAKAIIKTLQFYDIPIEGKYATIINNSKIVGKPTRLMLENLGATVTTCHDKTKPSDLEERVNAADILITAVPGKEFGQKGIINGRMIKQGAVVLDISEHGNFPYNDTKLRERASYMTYKSNGLGQVTRSMIQVNLGYCCYGLKN